MEKQTIRTKPAQRRPRPSRKPVPETTSVRSDDIARRAFEIYLARGASHGNALGDWIQAERELLVLP
ncbi:MAG TPA: DUF2934 domain-containing protein [Polyangiaceae bacterium]|jgi:hypothetical protein|nr:DUF2934 domain-containing protein [Polyangiaceae bacterium]